MTYLYALAGAVLLLAHPAAAQVRPQPGAGDGRLQTVEYAADQVVLLRAAAGYQLSVEFSPDERIESVAVGDSSAWQVTANRRGDRLFLKVLRPGVTTNMTVVTDTRTYLFDLAGAYDPAPDNAYIVRFLYSKTAPGAPAAAVPAIDAEYVVTGARALRPSAIGDDGIRTYIEWPVDRTLPAIYALDERGRETLVNGMMRDGQFVIDSVSQRLIFRIDRQIARATRKPKRGGE